MRRLAACLPLLILLAGCARQQPTAPVTGRVALNDRPLTTGRVLFVHEKGRSAVGDIRPDGTYQVMAPVGPNQVSVECLEDSAGAAARPNKYRVEKALAQSLIPLRYANHMTSGFTVDVQQGENKADLLMKD